MAYYHVLKHPRTETVLKGRKRDIFMKSPILHIALLASAALLVFTGSAYLTSHSSKEFLLSNEREIKANLQTGYGNIYISRGSSDKAVSAQLEGGEHVEIGDCMDYSVRDRVGYLDFTSDCKPGEPETRHGKSIHIDHLSSRDLAMQFTDAVPIAFDMELGLGKGDIDLTGLAVKDFSLSCGASSVELRIDRPNTQVIEDMSIEAGVSKFRAYGLCNARFRHLKFSGGVGSYALDFGGPLEKEVDADLEVGLGTLTVTIPPDIGAKVYYEKSWIAHLSIDRDFSASSRDENSYFSDNYYTAKGRLNLHIDAGLGSVKIHRSR